MKRNDELAAKLCDVCEEEQRSEAQVYCAECDKYYCTGCDAFFHQRGKYKLHTRENISIPAKELLIDNTIPPEPKEPENSELKKQLETLQDQLETKIQEGKEEEQTLLKELNDVQNKQKTCHDEINAFYTTKISQLEKERDEMQRGVDVDFQEQIGSIQAAVHDLEEEGKDAERVFGEIAAQQRGTLDERVAAAETAVAKLGAALEKSRRAALGAPEEISVSSVTDSSAELEWDDVIPESCGKITYTVEMRADGCQFVHLCEGNENVIKISGLENDTSYEFRVKAHFGGKTSLWSEIVHVHTLSENATKGKEEEEEEMSHNDVSTTTDLSVESEEDDDVSDDDLKTSKVVCGDAKSEAFLRSLFGEKRFSVLYQGSRDGFTAEAFHSKCNRKGPTLTLVKSTNGNVFGGYSTVSWGSKDTFRAAPGSFLLTLRNTYGTEPSTFSLLEPGCPSAIYDHYAFGPTFGAGCDLCLWPPFDKSGKSYSNLDANGMKTVGNDDDNDGDGNGADNNIKGEKRGSYRDVVGKGSAVFTGNESDLKTYFDVTEIEVYSLHWKSLDS